MLTEKANTQRHDKLLRWHRNGGVLIMGYNLFTLLASGKNVKRKKFEEDFKKYLLNPGPDIIVCDEGHVLRRDKSNLSMVINQIHTLRRIVLTGTPLQNNLDECESGRGEYRVV